MRLWCALSILITSLGQAPASAQARGLPPRDVHGLAQPCGGAGVWGAHVGEGGEGGQEPAVGEMPVQKDLHGVGGGDLPLPRVHAHEGGGGGQHVKGHDDRHQGGEGPPHVGGDLGDEAQQRRVEPAHPDHRGDAPEGGKDQVDPAVEAQGQVAVVPEAGAEKHLLHPGAGVLVPRPGHRAGQEDQRAGPALHAAQADCEEHGPQAPHQGEGAVEHAGAVLQLPPGEEHEQRLHQAAQERRDEKQPEELAEAGPLPEGGGLCPLPGGCEDAGAGTDGSGHDEPSLDLEAGGYHTMDRFR